MTRSGELPSITGRLAATAASLPARSGVGEIEDATLASGRIGRYRLEGVLGTGAMATVYAARDLTLHRPVALKVIRAGDDDAAIRRLVREAQAIAKISHPNVIHVYDVGWEASGVVYIAMEQISGVTLDRWVRSQRSVPEICEVFAAAGSGLAAAHDAGLIHRDFKPQNVIVGDDGRVRVLDFGLACAADPDHEIDSGGRLGGLLVGVANRVTAAGALVGTPAYMSPEQWRGIRADARSDQFAFCVSLFEAVVKQSPFDTSSRAVLREAVLAGARAAVPATVPRRLRSVLQRGLATAPEARFASMHALVAQLIARSRWPRRAAVAMAASTLAIAVWSLWRSPSSSPLTSAATLYRPPERITSRGDIGRAALSPDRRTVAYLTQDTLLIQPLRRDAKPRVLFHGQPNYDALSWSPDGRQLALVAAPAGARAAPGLVIIDVVSASARSIGPDPGSVALLGGGEVVTATFTGKELVFYSVTDATRPLRRCALPGTFSGIRSLGYQAASQSILVQLDRGDRESSILRIDRMCSKIATLTAAVPALSFVARPTDDRLFVRLMYRHDLVEIGHDGAPSLTTHLIQSNDYVPIAIQGDGSIVHVDGSSRWQLFSRSPAGDWQSLLAGADDSRFAIAPDGQMIAHVSGVYRDGVLRVGTLETLLTTAIQIGESAARTAWSPDGSRLAILFQSATSYELATWNRASGQLSTRVPLAIPYDSEMTWLDDRRVAFGKAPNWKGFFWVDPDTAQRGELALGGGAETRSLTRAPRSGQLAFLTQNESGVQIWTFWVAIGSQISASVTQVAEVPMSTPLVGRSPSIHWSSDGKTLLLADAASGELWKIDPATGRFDHLPGIPAPRGGGFTRINGVFPLSEQLLISTVTDSADIYVSARQAR